MASATRSLRRVAPFDGICVLLHDPATLLPTGELDELGEPDYNSFRALANGDVAVASVTA